ncbi:MAG: type VI secretion system tip protein VgrG, partial [Planctomycetales bacterium]|nr:type VI secretion system tip protein VgrG [Planctomycetales bacterium]
CSSEAGKKYVITKISHEAYETMAYESSRGAPPFGYRNEFRAIPDQVAFRPQRITPKPYVRGVQTATVVGPSGEEIYTDEFGRIKAQFHWDREGSKDENSSCWMRVSQIHAGKGFGGIDIPRIGEEVIVSFLEGDPDRPIITGRVYHAENMPPYGLPDKKVISGIKSKTYKGDGYNEYVMDDSPGNELIREHGQFDKDSTIEHDLREHVLNNRSRDVSVDETVTVGKNQSLTVGVNRTIQVGANHSETIAANMTINVGANLVENVAVNYAETVGAAMALTVGGVMTQTIGGAFVMAVGGAVSATVGGTQTTTVQADRKEQVKGKVVESVKGDVTQKIDGKHTEKVKGKYTVKGDASLLLQAADEIVLKTGASSITLKKSGEIKIKGNNITVEATTSLKEKALTIKSEASTSNTVKGTMVTVDAATINNVKGALVKIN